MGQKDRQKIAARLQKLEATASKTLTLEYVLPDDLEQVFSDNFFASHAEHEFVLSFFQSIHPPDMRLGALNKLKGIQSKCVSRVIVTPAQMERIINALIENWNRWEKTYKTTSSEESEAASEESEASEEKAESE